MGGCENISLENISTHSLNNTSLSKQTSPVKYYFTGYIHKLIMFNPQNCSICLETLMSGKEIGLLVPCGHVYHTECVNEMLKRQVFWNKNLICPHCTVEKLMSDCLSIIFHFFVSVINSIFLYFSFVCGHRFSTWFQCAICFSTVFSVCVNINSTHCTTLSMKANI